MIDTEDVASTGYAKAYGGCSITNRNFFMGWGIFTALARGNNNWEVGGLLEITRFSCTVIDIQFSGTLYF